MNRPAQGRKTGGAVRKPATKSNRRSLSEPAPQTRLRRLLPYVIGVLAALVLAAGGIAFAEQQNKSQQLGQSVPIQGREHIADGTPHDPYNSDPPTSGPHYVQPEDAGYYEQPLVDERVVHSLEHGYAVMSYDCSKLSDCAQVKQQLRQVVGQYSTWKVIAAPRQNKDAPLALTAWGRVLKLQDYDAAQVRAFIDAYRNKGPEATMN